ncbi:hypothetical protein F7734_26220 [Scytonema sp. UIC 10036]|uniref:hypothetical protein n=1 Tax=Scytonema sp. UIC 10036 TaxID=2304196 RepID=UPI0012DA7F65|nr:hypothetical protein [Scytonema sp. UIC 10036]MUG95662.1 hypothetical protein [Scytonema sp. UIC 10036]
MNISLMNEKLEIQWEWYEQMLAFNINKNFMIPLNHIEAVSIVPPTSSWTEIRSPGLIIPGVLKVGTYYSSRGKEFWYVARDRDYLTLDLKNESFNRIILTIDDNHTWLERINQFVPT